MASNNTSINENLSNHVSETNLGIQKIVSSKSIPLWINPNNTTFYTINPYNAGDIVILLSDLNEIYSLLQEYFESIARNIGVEQSFFFERNNPELNNSIMEILVYGGYITDDKYINPLTIVSTSEKGFGLYVSLKNKNYDIPGSSDTWFNLDMSESLDSMQLQLSRIISILMSDSYVKNLMKGCNDPLSDELYTLGPNSTYIENRLDMHKRDYHFGDECQDANLNVVNEAYEELNKIQSEIESHVNTTSSIMRNPFIMNGKIIGNMITVTQTTGQMFFYCILNTKSLEKDKDITIQFTPSDESNIIVPIIPRTNRGIITVDNPKTDKYVITKDGDYAWYVDSYVYVSNDESVANNITIETNTGFEDANFNNNFTGFLDTSYIASYTPIGAEIRTDNVAIHCSPVKEISRTNKTLTFQLSSDYVWKYTGLAIALSGKCEV